MIKAMSALNEAAKYITPTRKALENGGVHKLKNSAGELIGSTTISKRFENNMVHAQVVKQLKDGRFIQQARYEFGDGGVVSYTLKDSKTKGKEPFVSIVTKIINKAGKGEVTNKVTKDGDRFTAKINTFKPIDGKYQPVTQIYDTQPSEVKGIINPNKYTQNYLIETARKGFSTIR